MKLLRQFAMFAVVGATGTCAHYLVLIVLVSGLHFQSIPASAFGFLVGAAVNYRLNYVLTFRSKKRHYDAAMKFAFVAAIGLAINALIMTFGVSLGLHYLLAQLMATAVVLLWGFAGNRNWTFKGVA